MDYKALKWEVIENPNRPGENSIGLITLVLAIRARRESRD